MKVGHQYNENDTTELESYGIEVTSDVDDNVIFNGWKQFSWKQLLAFAGPGWLMSIAYLDPGNLEADLQQGVAAGYSLMWVLFWSTAIGLLLQTMAARLGTVTGSELASICRYKYSRPMSLFLWIMAEVAIIGSDIQEVVGSAYGLNILFGLPLWVGVLITGLDTFTFLILEKFGVRKLEALFCTLVATMALAFGYCFFAAGVDYGQIAFGTIVPKINERGSMQAVGMLGAVIMPHNLYLHSALVKSRIIDRSKPNRVHEANFYFAIESAMALGVSFIINVFVVAVFAHSFYREDPDAICDIDIGNGAMKQMKCSDIGLRDAAGALAAQLGGAARIVWGIGLLAAGQSSTMTGTYTGQFVMQGFLNLKISKWKRTLLTRCFAIVPAILVAILWERFLDSMDQYLNVLQSLVLPFAIIPLLRFVGSTNIMGEFVVGKKTLWLSWAMALLIVAINILLGYMTVVGSLDDMTTKAYSLMALCGLVYFAAVSYVSFTSFKIEQENEPLLGAGDLEKLFLVKEGYSSREAARTNGSDINAAA